MADVFISYARSNQATAQQMAAALRVLSYEVWLDDQIPAHRAYADVIEERLRASKSVVVIWSAEAAKSQWVRSEAGLAREAHKLVQLTVDHARLPMPFDQIECADLSGWVGDIEAPGWRKVVSSIAELIGGAPIASLRDAVTPLPLPSKPSIAVLPLINLSGDPDQEYFADGMVEEIVGALARFKSIFVIASGSSFALKGKGVAPRDAARMLGVHYVLDGSVRKAANRVRIAIRLMDAAGVQVWAERFDDTLEDVFALQDRVAARVAGVIEPAIEVFEIQRASVRPTYNMSSYELFLRAMSVVRSYCRADVTAALELFTQAITLDRGYALAMSMAAWCHSYLLSMIGAEDTERHYREGIDLSHRAVQLAGDQPDVLIFAANALWQLGEDLSSSIALIDRAIVLNPGSSNTWYYSSFLRLAVGEPAVAVDYIETTMRLDPLSPIKPNIALVLGWAFFEQGRFKEAVVQLMEAAQRTEVPATQALLAASCAFLGRLGPAQKALATYRVLSSVPVEVSAHVMFGRDDHRKMFLDGIALAQG